MRNRICIVIISFFVFSNINAQILKRGQFTFLKNYDASGYFAINDSIILCNNVNTGLIDVVNLFQRNVITSLNYKIITQYAPTSWDNAQDQNSIYFIGTQNGLTYFVKISKTNYTEIWKFKIDIRPNITAYNGCGTNQVTPTMFNPTYTFTLFNNKIVFFGGGALFHNKNSTVDIPVLPGFVIYDTAGFMLTTKKIARIRISVNCSVETEQPTINPILINKNNSLVAGFGIYANIPYTPGADPTLPYLRDIVRTDSFDISPINGPSNIQIGTTSQTSAWTNRNTTGAWSSSNNSVLQVAGSGPYWANSLGTINLKYTFTSSYGRVISNTMPIRVVNNIPSFTVKPDYCLMEFDGDLTYLNHRFVVGTPQGAYYDSDTDSTTIFGTVNSLFLSDVSYKSGSTFNFKYSFKSLSDTGFLLNTYTGSAGAGSSCYFGKLDNKQFYYLPFVGSVLYSQPYTSIGTENFLTGLMDNNNRSVIDETKSFFFRNLTNIYAKFSKGKNFQFIATDNKDFFTDMRYTDTGLYIMAIDKNGLVNPDSLSNLSSCPPPIINYAGSTQICQGSTLLLTSTSSTGNQWYNNGTPINGATSSTYNVTVSGSYTVATTINNCTSPQSAPVVVTINSSPSVPDINWDGSHFSTTSSGVNYQWFLNGNIISGATSANYTPTSIGNYQIQVTSNGCTNISNPYNLVVTGIDPNNLPSNFIAQIIPNPAADKVVVHFTETPESTIQLQLINNVGTILKTIKTKNTSTIIDINKMPAGSYYIKIIGGKYNQIKKLEIIK